MFIAILASIISIGVLILVHEYGHFVFCRIFGIKVDEFCIGFPPRICGIYKKDGRWKFFFGKSLGGIQTEDTIYSLNWIPFGGLNKIESGGEETGVKSSGRDFFSKPWWQRALVASGGVIFNVVLAFVLLSIAFSIGSYQDIDAIHSSKAVIRDINLRIIYIQPDSPAQKVGLKSGDIVSRINEVVPDSVKEAQNLIGGSVNRVNLEIIRRKQKMNFEIEAQSSDKVFGDSKTEQENKKSVIGVALARLGKVSFPWYLAIGKGFLKTFQIFGSLFYSLYLIVKNLITEQRMIGEFIGVIGLAAITTEAARIGFDYLIQFVALLSLAIAATQLLPIPAIDGGKILVYILEGIRKRPINRKLEGYVDYIGFWILIGLMAILTYRDIVRIIKGAIHQ